ncbi:TonB-dependent receptor [Edaphobacter sp. 12200R-103]|jgi:outer membrane receptor protein involved in Fe transport|uniref:TonB-dependent receptor n=1 Tax=Edaphobacter sp. 12200R-103 TaxID=2703788 RepID=UPI00138B4F5C|nr:TonB-dependent receptor [Edaphobacter sp. 12200R-103]QHS52279.1 TonB-dependent receptor [Edaphobacter sp. 12200R-103]
MQLGKAALRRVAVALLFAGLATISAYSQNIFGSIVGTVDDQSGAVLPNVAITVTNPATGEKRSVTTDNQGNYQVLSLPRGEYTIDIDATGFKHFTRTPINVVVNQVVRVDVTMSIGEQTQTVDVTGATPILQTDTTSLGQAIEGTAVRDLPLNGRNVLALVALVPGVVPQGASNTNLSGQNVFAAGNFQIGGGNANQGSVLVDGVSVNTSYGNAVELVMDQDSIQEFNVQTHNNTAEFGKYTGGVINMSTKSGSNTFHGTAYEYLRNTVLNANSFFAKRNNSGKQAWHQNQFGANISGPVMKNKIFFFGAYQGYRQTNGQLVLVTVPTEAELKGDFSGISAPIYDPLTTCGTLNNPACTAAQSAGTAPTRRQFSYNGVANVIPPNRLSSVAKNLIAFPIYGLPNVPGTPSPQGPLNNFSRLATAGGINDQYTARGDQNLNSKFSMFERYTRWNSRNIDPQPFPNNNLYYIALAPEVFSTNQIVVGGTYLFNANSVADLRLGYLRWNYNRIPTNLGLNESTAFGWPSYMDFGHLNNLPKSTAVPMISTGGPISYYEGSAGYIFSINNNYSIASTYQRVWKRHTFKMGVDLRRLEMNYFQNNNPGGIFTFDNIFTSQSTGSPGATGNPLASFELGYVSTSTAQTVQIAPPTYQTLRYQGYFFQDTWQITNKLTATLGLRYEVPGTFIARHGWANTFNPTEINPILNIPGAYDLVSSPQHPAAGVYNENWTDWAPRVGLAYRLDDNTVIRGAFGKFFVPADLQFPSAPLQAGVNFLNNLMVNTIDGQQTPYNTLDNPYPSGLQGPPHRDPSYQQVLLGGNAQALYADEPNGLTYQWNLTAERQFWKGIALSASYAGLRGEHLPISVPINPLSDSVISQAAADPNCSSGSIANCFLNVQAANPYYPKISQGTLRNPTVTRNQLLRPFPQYGGITNSGHYVGISNYHSLELKLQKRMPGNGQILGSYTFSKLLTNAEYLTSWLDATGTGGFSNYNNLDGEYALSSFDARQRLVVAYVYPLPFGKGQRFLFNLSGVGNALLGGWGVQGITTFQQGLPLALTNSTNTLSTYAFQGSMRPMYVPDAAGCNGTKKNGGSMYNRLGGPLAATTYFNTSCFVQQSVNNPYVFNRFQYGNESRTDNTLRGPGQANWDMSLYKDIPIHENMKFNLRVEAFNLFNRVQFGNPNTSVGNALFGNITTQINNPRAFQLSGRFLF